MNTNRKTIGILVSTSVYPYEVRLMKNIVKATADYNFNLLFFSGASDNITNIYNYEKLHLYNLIDLKRLDGLILAGGSLKNTINKNTYETFLNAFSSIPTVSLSVECPHTYNIIIDNRFSIRSMVDHVINQHQCKKINIVLGNADNYESNERYQGYKDALSEHNIDIEDDRVYIGNYQKQSGIDAVNFFLNQTVELPDAIICCNDTMAMGAYMELTRRGIRVPYDIILTGFDNNNDTKKFFPSITTINHPFDKMSKQALSILDNLFNNQKCSKKTVIKTDLVLNESCGCKEIATNYNINKIIYEIASTELKLTQDDNHQIVNYIINNFDQLINLTIEKLEAKEYSDIYIPLITNFLNIIIKLNTIKHTNEKFINYFDTLIYNSVVVWQHNLNWKETIEYMENLFNKTLTSPFIALYIPLNFLLLKTILNKAYNYLATIDNQKLLDLNKQIELFIYELNDITNLSTLKNILEKYIKLFNFKEFYLCLHNDSINNNFKIPEKTNLVFGYYNGTILNDIEFNTSNMLPEFILNRDSNIHLSFFPLCLKNNHFGYFASDVLYEAKELSSITKQLVNTLERLNLYKQLDLHTKKIEDLSNKDDLTGLFNRRGFYLHGTDFYNMYLMQNKDILCIYGDMDNLKKINDSYGHNEGDLAIITVAKSIRQCFRDTDVFARIGGDEFIIIITKEKNHSIETLIERIYVELKAQNDQLRKPYNIEISFGYSCCNNKNILSFQELINKADKMLYKVKKIRKQKNNI